MPARTADPTPRQLRVLAVIRGFLLDHGRPPTIRELCRLLGVSSPNGMMCHIRALIRRRLLQEAGGKATTRRYVPTEPVAEAAVADGRVRLATTGPVLFTPDEWRAWLVARLAELGDAA